MAENLTLARPYAEAAFALARDSDQLAAWADVLERLALIVSEPEVLACMADPRLSGGQLTTLLAESVGLPVSDEQRKFIDLLVANDRAVLLPEVRSLFVLRKNEREQIKDAQVSSAFPISDASLKQLATDLEARFGSRLRITLTVDPELIGGIHVAVGNEVIDASVRGKLATMAAALKN